MRRRRVGGLIGLACAVSAIGASAATGGLGAGVAGASGSWSVIKSFPTVETGMTAVSCPTSAVCEVVGGINASGTILRTVDGAHSWQQQSVPSGLSPQGISCVSANQCVAVGVTVLGNGGVVLATSDGGQHWTQVAAPAGAWLDAVRCQTSGLCVAVGGRILVSTDGGTTWSSAPMPPNVFTLGGVDCWKGGHCVAVGESDASNPAAVSLTTTDQGRSWTFHQPTLSTTDSSLNAVSCVQSACSAVGTSSGGALALTSTDGGSTWSVSTTPAGVLQILSESCRNGGKCVAVGTTDFYVSFLDSLDGGRTWTAVDSDLYQGTAAGVGCAPSGSLCTATGWDHSSGPLLFASRNFGGAWATSAIPPSTSQLSSVSCASATVCATAGATVGGSTLFSTRNGGSSWSAKSLTGADVSSVSCALGTKECMAVGSDLDVTVDGGRTWTSSEPSVFVGATLTAVTCSTSIHCVVLGESDTTLGDEIFVTNDFGTTWSVFDAPTTGNLESVACSTELTCVAVGTHILTSQDGGSTWNAVTSYPAPNGALWGVSCPAGTSTCFAAGVEIGLTNTGVVLMSGDNGATWTQLSLSPDVLPLNGISCTSALICDAVGGSVISTSDGGQTWASVADPGEFVFSVDCVSSTCLAVGSNQVLEGPA